jgi:hypothetical protein
MSKSDIDEAELDVVIYTALPEYLFSMEKAVVIRKAVMAYLATRDPPEPPPDIVYKQDFDG